MSRASYPIPGHPGYTFAFGVDHTPMGTFFQILVPDGDGCVAEGDAMFGINICIASELKAKWPHAYGVILDGMRGWTKQNCNLSASFIFDLGKALGIGKGLKEAEQELERRIYELWD